MKWVNRRAKRLLSAFFSMSLLRIVHIKGGDQHFIPLRRQGRTGNVDRWDGEGRERSKLPFTGREPLCVMRRASLRFLPRARPDSAHRTIRYRWATGSRQVLR